MHVRLGIHTVWWVPLDLFVPTGSCIRLPDRLLYFHNNINAIFMIAMEFQTLEVCLRSPKNQHLRYDLIVKWTFLPTEEGRLRIRDPISHRAALRVLTEPMRFDTTDKITIHYHLVCTGFFFQTLMSIHGQVSRQYDTDVLLSWYTSNLKGMSPVAHSMIIHNLTNKVSADVRDYLLSFLDLSSLLWVPFEPGLTWDAPSMLDGMTVNLGDILGIQVVFDRPLSGEVFVMGVNELHHACGIFKTRYP